MKRNNVFTFKVSKKFGVCPLFHVKRVVSLGGNAFFPSNSQSVFQKQKMQLNKISLTLCSRDLLIAWSANFVIAQWKHMETPKNENNRSTQWKERWLFVHNPGLRFTNDPEAIESQFERIDDVIMGGRYPVSRYGLFAHGCHVAQQKKWLWLVLSRCQVWVVLPWVLATWEPVGVACCATRVAASVGNARGRASLLVLSSYGLKNIFPNYYISFICISWDFGMQNPDNSGSRSRWICQARGSFWRHT